MNIKSLLLGSAAALAAVTGAQAADAIVAAEPEPLEYVRVCDAFGTGYFYIPGTETCLKIGGYIRVDFNGGDVLGQNTYPGGGGDSWDTLSRFDLRVSTATDTEYGALKTYAEVEFDRKNNASVSYDGELDADGDGFIDDDASFTNLGGGANLAHAYIEFAGFLIGYTDTVFAGGFIGGGYAMNDYIMVDYGDFKATQLRYTFGGDTGFAATIALEDGSNAQIPSVDTDDDSYVPDVAGGIAYRGGSFEAFLVGGYDAGVEEGAIKGRLNATFGAFSAFVMAGWNTDGDVGNTYARWSGDWAVWLGAAYDINEKINVYADLNFQDGIDGDSAGDVEASVGVAYTVVPGFVIQPEVSYVSDYDDIAGPEANDWGAKIRFQRSF